MSLLLLLRGEQNVKPARRPQRPSLKLHVEVETVDGSIHRWDSDDLTPQNRPLSVSWRTQRGDGFADGSLSLRRDVLKDWPDLNLVDTVRIIGADGGVRYEGRNVNNGRETGDNGPQFSIQLAGWMSHAKDRRFRNCYIDRDASHWSSEPSLNRQLAALAGSPKYKLSAGQASVIPAPDGSGSAVNLSFSRVAKSGAYYPTAEVWYSPEIPIGYVSATYSDSVATGGGLSAAGGWSAILSLSSDDVFSAGDFSSNLAGTSGQVTVSASGGRQRAAMGVSYQGADVAADGEWNAYFANPYVVGVHGIPVSGGGLTAADMIRNSALLYCPKLDISGVEDTTYPIRHAAPIDPTYPHDFWLQLNTAHLWELEVFEDRKLLYHPPLALDDYDWQVRTDDPGVRINYGGSSLADLGNGVEVAFDDLETGTRKLITPEDYSDLADPDPNNPLSKAGVQKWLTYDVPFPTLEADAVQYGRMYLQEAIRAKAPATINTGFWVRDRGGAWQPASKIRCGERIAITNHPNDAPRRIVDSNYTHDGRGLVISADRASTRMSAITDRISLARTAASLS